MPHPLSWRTQAPRAAGLVLLVTIAACGTTVVYTPAAHRSAVVESAQRPAHVEVYDKVAPARPGQVIGTLATQPDSIYVDTQLDGALVAEMQRVATRAGCNALVMEGSTPAPNARFGGRASATVSYFASCLVYTDGK